MRDQRQKEFAQEWLDSNRRGILHLCPRFGKIYTSINILEEYPEDCPVLIAYPDKEIKTSWDTDFEKRGYINHNLTYSTHISLHKLIGNKYSIIIIDEIHLLSEAQISSLKALLKDNPVVLGLSGTMSKWTAKTLEKELNLPIIAEYPIEQAIEEGVVVDYEITVVKVPLDNQQLIKFKKKLRTEKRQFDAYTWVIQKNEDEGNPTMFLRLGRMRIIQGSLAKKNATRKLLSQYANERVLVFCGLTKIADSLGIPAYHNKVKENDVFKNFLEGKGNKMAVVKIGNTGSTYKPLNRVVINYFDSNSENLAQKINRCMGMEYNNPDKKAHITIVSSNEAVELKWLDKALEFFDKKKIKYLEMST